VPATTAQPLTGELPTSTPAARYKELADAVSGAGTPELATTSDRDRAGPLLRAVNWVVEQLTLRVSPHKSANPDGETAADAGRAHDAQAR
jgi:hypothetical protein